MNDLVEVCSRPFGLSLRRGYGGGASNNRERDVPMNLTIMSCSLAANGVKPYFVCALNARQLSPT